MKRLLVFAFVATLTGSLPAMAQGGQRQSIEERVKRVHEKIDSAFKLEAAKLIQTDSVFAKYYRATDKVREDLVTANGGERPDFQVLREKRQPFVDERDKELKLILGDANFKVWKDQIEPSMRPQRPGGGGNG